jgi:hypothetical protein
MIQYNSMGIAIKEPKEIKQIKEASSRYFSIHKGSGEIGELVSNRSLSSNLNSFAKISSRNISGSPGRKGRDERQSYTNQPRPKMPVSQQRNVFTHAMEDHRKT